MFWADKKDYVLAGLTGIEITGDEEAGTFEGAVGSDEFLAWREDVRGKRETRSWRMIGDGLDALHFPASLAKRCLKRGGNFKSLWIAFEGVDGQAVTTMDTEAFDERRPLLCAEGRTFGDWRFGS